ncbi:MAG: 2Fe-2S iron-sulfur cluster-binding protein [Xanthomonadales bacterium]|nr:2Fe-2S iron-sulfur cluster-binding protein [Xanthomonadales bacterium]
MVNLTFNNNTYQHQNDETVLDTLLRNGVDVAFSCRNGVCQTCLVRAVVGEVSEESQKGLNNWLVEKNYFLPCKCNPVTDLVIEERQDADFINTAVVSDKKNESWDSKSEDQSLKSITKSNKQTEEVAYPSPIPELWAALNNGELLHEILNEFYDAVFIDPILSPYFKNSTKQRAKEKVYSFYRRVFTGEEIYFGDRPRNAHHWMVINNSVFEHRENLLEHYMRKHGLSEKMIHKWQQLEELYRPDILKDKPRGRMVGDIETPASGFGKIVLDMGGICDICNNEIETGLEVSYHLRTGEVCCNNCSNN